MQKGKKQVKDYRKRIIKNKNKNKENTNYK